MCGKYLKYEEVYVERRTLDKATAHTAKLHHQLHLRQFTSVGGGNAVLALTDTDKDFTTHHALQHCVSHVIQFMVEVADSDSKRFLLIENWMLLF